MRVDFYHLQKQILDDVLPKLLEKAYSTGKKIKVKVGTEQRVDFLNSLLWTYNEESFLPHGSKKDANAELQPIWLSDDENNPNRAEFLFLVDGATETPDVLETFERVFNIFDGNSNEALNKAREFWKQLKSANAELHYWQQSNDGRWSEK
ncbi:MAG: DNA polymerase III subunit chi [Alphaproteobacteria bacterium]|nr:DNA polymerase III subunit chi [Alphaproteobacteria bacterium]MBQ2810617.1 DNA polymerase III subunit chi [Alphaproteobacteria bacterium]